MEKKFDVKIYRLSGESGPPDREWSTTYTYEPPDEESKSLRGTLFVVLDLSSSAPLDLPLAAKLVLDVLCESYYADKEGSPLKALEKALLESKHRLVGVAFGAQEQSRVQLDFNIVAAVLWGTVVYLAKIGNVASYLLRKEHLTEIGPQEEGNISIASGIVKAGDTLILGSKAFRESGPPQNLRGALPNLKKAAEDLSFEKEQTEGEDIKVKNVYPVSISIIILEFMLHDVPGEEEVLKIYDVEPSRRPSLKPKFLLNKGISLFKRFRDRIKSGDFRGALVKFISRLKLGESQIYIRRAEEPMMPVKRASPRLFLMAILGLTLVFTFSVVFTISKRRSRAHSVQIARFLEEARENLDKAQNLVDLNNVRAREHLEVALEAADAAAKLAPKPISELESLKEEISKLSDKVNRITRLTQVDLFYDFTIQSKSSQPVSITGSSGSLVVADRGEATVYKLKFKEAVPKVERASLDRVEDLKAIVSGTGRLFILRAPGLAILNLGDGSLVSGDLTLGEDWQNIISFDIYIDSLYLLSTSSNRIYRTTVSGNDFSSPINWLDEEANLADAVSMSIDGDIYVLKKISGEIMKFSQGRLVDFKLQELDKPLKDPRAIYTTPDSNFLYLLDSGNKRVIIVSKQGGIYQQQLVYASGENAWNDLKSLWVDEENTVVYVLDGTRVYRVDY